MTKPDTNNRTRDLIAELALGYYSDEELCLRFEVSQDRLDWIRSQPTVQKMVQAQRREFVEAGDRFRLMAKQLITEALNELGALAFDPRAEVTERLRAIEMLARYAGFDKPQGNTGTSIVINTNIATPKTGPGTTNGEYVIDMQVDNDA